VVASVAVETGATSAVAAPFREETTSWWQRRALLALPAPISRDLQLGIGGDACAPLRRHRLPPMVPSGTAATRAPSATAVKCRGSSPSWRRRRAPPAKQPTPSADCRLCRGGDARHCFQPLMVASAVVATNATSVAAARWRR